ncbi:DUF4129 domain-containing protein [Actinomadura parmotrematis]|uniref:DUF4129 domain-containing protein n=1 Tax=Actinomadura parmotrematis TaxID=2864039 RepID=A0ABS7FVX3_9ACTN|nr:DUF4129 domain-containing protein [Actinomadura parmotrematis]MBW8484574.1 DUF4129 domain-containing protein [Actinomadura parmotrematis]
MIISVLRGPEPVDRGTARELARRELEKPVYHRDRSSWLERTLQRFSDWLHELTSRAGHPTAQGGGSGWITWLVIALLAVLAVALVTWLMWGRRNVRSAAGPLLEDAPTSARGHREEAAAHAAAGRWPEAIRERLRAVARDLEERAVLDPRPGRTADELAAEAGAALPALAGELRAGVLVFDDVWYGDRPGSAAEYDRLVRLDDAVRATRPRPLGEDGDAGTGEAEALRW